MTLAQSTHRPAGPIRLLKFVVVFGFGGTERQFVNLGLGLDPGRVAVRFGCLRRWGHFLADVEARGIPVDEYRVRSFRDPRVLGAQLRLARDIRRHGVQIVHTYNFYANVFAVPAARLAGARIVASIRDLGPYLSPLQRRLQRWVCRLADCVLVNAHAIRDWLVADGYDARRIMVIHNGIDLARFATTTRVGWLRPDLGLSDDVPLVGVLSRLSRVKRLEDLLQAAALLSPDFPRARFLIVGEGFAAQGDSIVTSTAYQEQLLALAHRLGLQDRLIFTGFRPDIEHLLPELSVSVLPSHSEGLSNVLLESMAAGVPVVASRVGGTPEAIQDGQTGLLVPAGDPRALADAIRRVLSNSDLARRLGTAARQAASDRFSMPQLIEATTDLYDSLLSTAPQGDVRAVPVTTH